MGLSPLVLLQLSAEDGPRVALTAAVVSTGHGEERVRGEASGRSVEDGACCEGKGGGGANSEASARFRPAATRHGTQTSPS